MPFVRIASIIVESAAGNYHKFAAARKGMFPREETGASRSKSFTTRNFIADGRNFMNEEPKSIWKKSWTGWRGWLALMAVVLAGFLFLVVATGTNLAKSGNEFRLLGIAAIAVTLIFLLATFVRWMCCWRNFKKFLFGLACLIALIVLGYAEENWRGKHDWEKFKHEWEAKGEHFDFASVIPPAVPDEQNFALTPVVFTCYGQMLTRDGKVIHQRYTNWVNRLEISLGGNEKNWKDWPTNGYWPKQTLTDLRGRQQFYRALAAKTDLFPVSPQPQSPAADVLLALSKYDATVEELRQASQLPYSRFPLNYDTECPADIFLPHLAAMRRCAQVLQLRAIAELQNGQSEKAAADVALTLRLTETFRSEPFLISHLVRFAMTEIALQPIYEGLANRQWTDAQLAEIDAALAKLNFLADYKLSMRGELGMLAGVIGYLRQHPEQIINLSGENRDNQALPFPARMVWKIIPSGFFYQNQLRCARVMVKYYIPLADVNQQTISPPATRRADEVVSAETIKGTPYNLIERMLMPALGAAVKKCAREQISVDLARTAIALERYRLAHGEFPESLDALAPQFIAQVPHDVIGGQPLKYRRTNDGQFDLYSVGWNEKDDGGVTGYRKNGTVPDFESGDWVWRYPQRQ